MRVALVSTLSTAPVRNRHLLRDLREALLSADGVTAVDLAAIVRDPTFEQAPEVAGGSSRISAATIPRPPGCSTAAASTWGVEHEYGIFGGPMANTCCRWHVSCISQSCDPHTVLSVPSVGQAETLRALCDLSTLVCVFTETARRRSWTPASCAPSACAWFRTWTDRAAAKANGRRRLRLPRRHADEPARSIDRTGACWPPSG